MGATFGDLIRVAEQHWAGAFEWSKTPGQSDDPSTRYELGRAVRVLVRYAEMVDAGFAAKGRNPAVLSQARQCGETLRGIATDIASGVDVGTPPCKLARQLSMGSRALGCGADLLTAHFTVFGRAELRAQTVMGEMLASELGAEFLLSVVSEQSAHLADLAKAIGLSGISAGLEQIAARTVSPKASETPGLGGISMPEGATAEAVALPNALPERVPLVPSEGRDRALSGLMVNALWLQESGTPQTARTWRSLATSTRMTCEISGHALRLLMARARELKLDAPLQALRGAEARMGELVEEWENLSQLWSGIPCDNGSRLDPMAADAGEAVIRLGRLIYTDREWKPGANAVFRTVAPRALAPGREQASHIASAIEAVTRIPQTIAARALDGLSRGGITGLKSGGRFEMRRDQFAQAYLRAGHKAGEARGAVAAAARVLAGGGEERPGRLALEGFPSVTRFGPLGVSTSPAPMGPLSPSVRRPANPR